MTRSLERGTIRRRGCGCLCSWLAAVSPAVRPVRDLAGAATTSRAAFAPAPGRWYGCERVTPQKLPSFFSPASICCLRLKSIVRFQPRSARIGGGRALKSTSRSVRRRTAWLTRSTRRTSSRSTTARCTQTSGADAPLLGYRCWCGPRGPACPRSACFAAALRSGHPGLESNRVAPPGGGPTSSIWAA